MRTNYDVIVVGAGVMGACASLHLSRRGLKVALIDKNVLGAGSTGKSSANVQQHYTNATMAKMALQGLRAFQNFKEETGGESGFVRAGHLVLTLPSDAQGLAENVKIMREHGIAAEILSREDIRRRWPHLHVNDIATAAYNPESGYADPNSTLNSYIRAARQLGVSVFLETPVTKVLLTNGIAQGVEAGGTRFSASQVLNCCGAWGARVAQLAGVSLPIKPYRVQIALYRKPAGHPETYPIIADFAQGVYWRPETGGLILVGGMLNLQVPQESVDPDSYREQADIDFLVEAGERLVRRFPAMELAESRGGYAAIYDATPDGHPIIDEVPPGSGYFVCAGFSGQGFKFCHPVGMLVADMLTGETISGIDRRIFRLSRFEENDPVLGHYEYSRPAGLAA
jgi:sarcosine oxidase subunit beta